MTWFLQKSTVLGGSLSVGILQEKFLLPGSLEEYWYLLFGFSFVQISFGFFFSCVLRNSISHFSFGPSVSPLVCYKFILKAFYYGFCHWIVEKKHGRVKTHSKCLFEKKNCWSVSAWLFWKCRSTQLGSNDLVFDEVIHSKHR